MKAEKRTYQRSVKLFWIVFSIGVLCFISIFLAAGFGLLGKMPEFRQLENPKTNLATQIYSSDKSRLFLAKITDMSTSVYNKLRSLLYLLIV